MGQAHEVAAQLFGPCEQLAGIFGGVSPPAAVGLLVVDADALEEDGLAVEQNLLVACFDGAEADLVGDGRRIVKRDVHLVEFGILRAPQLGFELCKHLHPSVGISRDGLLQLELGDVDGYGVACLCLAQTGAESQAAAFQAHHLHVVVLDVNGRHLHQLHIAGDAAVVPPVEDQRGHILGVALVVHLHDDRVLTLLQHLCDIEVEGCESADVMPGLLAVHPYAAVVVRCPEVEQGFVSALNETIIGFNIETLLEPHGALVEEQSFVLCVPVAWNLHRGRLVEVVLDEVFGLLGLRIAEESPGRRIHAVVVVALFLHVYDVVPCPVERQTLIGVHVLDHRQRVGCGHGGEQHSHKGE